MQRTPPALFQFSGLCILLFFLGSAAVQSQKRGYASGYVITLEGDTIRGLVKDRSLGTFETLYRKIRFKSRWRKRKYRPDEIRGYGYKGYHFESVQISEDAAFFRFDYYSDPGVQPVFLRVVQRIPGLVLYAWEYEEDDTSYIEDFPLFYRTEEDKWVRATQGIFGLKRKKLIPFFADCPALALGIQEKTVKNVFDILDIWENTCNTSRP